MNKQKAPNGIEWTRIQNTDGAIRTGYTWNPVKGCKHACEWRMPDGSIAECYAKTVAERLAVASYPKGFAHLSFDEKELDAPRKVTTGAGIFCDSMSDLVGAGVPSEWIERVIQVMRETPQHIYQLLTKNPPRLREFKFPPNVWVGVSAPPTFMYGKELTLDQQRRFFDNAMRVLRDVDVPVRWASVEPLSWNVAPIIAEYPGVLQWAVIGAASNGRTYYAPDATDFLMLQWELQEQGVPIFYKGNMRILHSAKDNWLEQFPPENIIYNNLPVLEPVRSKPEQLYLFDAPPKQLRLL